MKVHAFCCKPLLGDWSWSSWLPATSFAPVVTTALYLVPLAKTVVELPKGLSVAVSPSVLRLTLTLVICVVPLEVTFKSLKVVAGVFMEEAIIFSEKVAMTLVEGATPVALAAGEVLVTLGRVVSVVGGGGVVVVVAHSAERQPSPEQALRALRRLSRVE